MSGTKLAAFALCAAACGTSSSADRREDPDANVTDGPDASTTPAACPAACPTPSPAAVPGQLVVIESIDIASGAVVLRNASGAAIDTTGWHISTDPDTAQPLPASPWPDGGRLWSG